MLVAQTLPPAPTAPASRGDETVALSPFVINENAETGWIATETLAGSRLRTNFKDVPNQIETLTKDFMTDLGVTSVEQALIYTANVENINDYQPFVPGSAAADPGQSGRVRGIGGGTRSRNFFPTQNPTDNYNIDRVTVASGPNAILFGLGSPAGILDATPARAVMRNKYGFTLQFDSENSKRGTFDANQVLIKDRLAIRLMGLSKREYTEKKPNLDRDERIYGAVTFQPFKSTTLILQGERDNRNWNRAVRQPPADFVSLWYNADRIPGSSYTTSKPIYDNTSFTNIATNIIFNRAGNVPVLTNDGQPMRNWNNSVTVRNPSTLPGTDATYDGDNSNVMDPRIYSFEANMVGTSRTTILGAITKNAILEQKLAPNLFLELAYNHERAYNHRLHAMGGGTGDFMSLHVDANRFLPGTTTPNPNVGKLYYQGVAQNVPNLYGREDWRATLSYEFDAARKLGERNRLFKWLGRHRVAGLYTGSKNEARQQQGWTRRIFDDPVIPGITLTPRTQQNWAINASRAPQFRHYFNSPTDTASAPIPFNEDVTLLDANNRPYTLWGWDHPLVSATSGKRLGGSSVPTGVKNKNAAQIFAWQGFFLPDREQQSRLVLTYGYRKDTAKSKIVDAASTTQDFSGLFPSMWDVTYGPYGAPQTGINRNVGVVARPLKWLSVFYNQSTSFDLNQGRYDPFGNEIPGASGDGKDYGLRFDLWTDKVTLRVNKYENALGPQRATNQINDPARAQMFMVDNRYRELDPTGPTINIVDGNRLGFRTAGQSNYWIMSNFEGKGYEVELNVTPTRNWNIRANGSKSTAVESGIGTPWFEWLRLREPVWKALVAKNGEVDAQGRPVTWATAPFSASSPNGQTLQQFYQNTLGASLAFIQAVDGRVTDSARPARANLITNYRVSEGRLRGLNFGGAARWRAAPTVGYGVSPGANGASELDLDKAYKGRQEIYFDALIGYRGRMKAFGNLAYRLQLNVRNVLDDDEPVPVMKTTRGETVRIATVEPRIIVMTFSVDF
jgi:iron complex outermembrane recepter protein